MNIHNIQTSLWLAQNAAKTQNTSGATAFLDLLQNLAASYSSAAGTVKTTAQMNMAEYKQYIYDKISQIPINSSRALETISVNISEQGFAAMKDDPGYEQWVLDGLTKDFAVYNPWVNVFGGMYTVHYFGATKDEYRGQSWAPGHKNGKDIDNGKSKDGFWEKRAKRQREYIQKCEEIAWEKRLLAQRLQRQELALLAGDGTRAAFDCPAINLPAAAGLYMNANLHTGFAKNIIF